MIASWPGVIAAGSVNRETVMSMDFLPTFPALAGAKITGEMRDFHQRRISTVSDE